jgi:hypothetical protein
VTLKSGTTTVDSATGSCQVQLDGVSGQSTYTVCVSGIPTSIVSSGTYCTTIHIPNVCGPNCVQITLHPATGTGQPYTIGFWKNWASCSRSNGHQSAQLDAVLSNGGVNIGNIHLGAGDCVKAVALLSKTGFNGGRSGTPIVWNVVAQLLGAELNVANGACHDSSVDAYIAEANSILVAIHFNGNTFDSLSSQQQSRLGALNDLLDSYNNGRLGGCSGGSSGGAPTVSVTAGHC